MLQLLSKNNAPYYIVNHPAKTISVHQKRSLLKEFVLEYSQIGSIDIVKGALLSFQLNGLTHFILHFSDAESKIDFGLIRKRLSLTKKNKLRFYKGNIKPILGINSGAVSPFVHKIDLISKIYFQRDLVNHARNNCSHFNDLALSNRSSVMTNVAYVYDILNFILPDKVQLI